MVIFVGGIHGAGKSKICKDLSSILNFPFFSSSEIIKWNENNIDAANKYVNDISYTQTKLIEGLNEIKKHTNSFILDGHFCLFDKTGKPINIDFKIFNSISPNIIIVQTENIKTIQDRLLKRDNKKYDINTLKQMEIMELSNAKNVSELLKVPIFILNRLNFELIYQKIKEII
jgi:adenylate kinase